MKFEDIIKLRLNNYEIKYPEKKLQDEGLEGSCWEGYEPIGMKEKDGKMVPNCVKIENQSKVKEGFPVPSPSGDEDENTFVSRCISEIIDEYGQEQSAAICYSKWREK
jgi:hypothetical protein